MTCSHEQVLKLIADLLLKSEYLSFPVRSWSLERGFIGGPLQPVRLLG
jgi:hypothetical protein